MKCLNALPTWRRKGACEMVATKVRNIPFLGVTIHPLMGPTVRNHAYLRRKGLPHSPTVAAGRIAGRIRKAK